jgi:DNA polymerase-3 subunit beta
MITLNVSFLKAAMLFSSAEETRYYLCGVHVLRRGAHLRLTATDGHRLFCAMQTLGDSGDDFDIILPSEGLKKALTGLHRSTEDLALELERGERAGRDVVIRATLNDINMTRIDGTFPDVSRVIPDANAITGEVAAFNPLYLADIGKAAKILCGNVNGFHLGHNGGSPALVSFEASDAAFAVVMPYRCRVAPIVSSTVADIIGRDAPAADEKAA